MSLSLIRVIHCIFAFIQTDKSDIMTINKLEKGMVDRTTNGLACVMGLLLSAHLLN